MPETRPISERIDLKYVRRRSWPNSTTWTLSILAVGALLIGGAGAELLKDSKGVYAHTLYSSGPMTKAHAMFGDDCAKCHESDPSGSRFWLGSSDAKCIACHETQAVTHVVHPSGQSVQRKYDGDLRVVSGINKETRMSGSCAACHIEHRGPDNDLRRVSDGVCTSCHANLKRDGFKNSASGVAFGVVCPVGIETLAVLPRVEVPQVPSVVGGGK